MKVAWLPHTFLYVLFKLSNLEQVTETIFERNFKKKLRWLNTILKYVHKTPVPISIPKLDSLSLRIIGFSSVSFANNRNYSNQIEVLILVILKFNCSVPIYLKHYIKKRMLQSLPDGELTAFSVMFEYEFAFSNEHQLLHQKSNFSLCSLNDSKSLFFVISKKSRTLERRLMLEIGAAREAFRKQQIFDIDLIQAGDNSADGLSKRTSQTSLRMALFSHLNIFIHLINR